MTESAPKVCTFCDGSGTILITERQLLREDTPFVQRPRPCPYCSPPRTFTDAQWFSARHGDQPDETEREIACAVDRLTEQPWNRRTCTEQLNLALGKLAEGRGFQRYARYLKGGSDDEAGGWLYDMTWLNKGDGEIVLALESEWDESQEPHHTRNIDHDFQKLLSVKATHRAFIFCDRDVESQLDRLVDQVHDFPQTQGGDRFLFIGLDCQTKRVVREKVIVAPGPSYAQLLKQHNARMLAEDDE